MILIGRRALLFLWVVVLVVTGFLGIFGYQSIATAGSDAAVQFRAQQFFYLALLAFIIEAALFLRTLLRSRNIQRELDKLIDITRYRGLTEVQSLSRLGPIGDQIHRLYDRLNALSERKTLKISSLSELAEFLMTNLSAPAAATTVDGTVVYVSRALTEHLKRTRNELIDSRIEELAPGLLITEVVAELERSHASIQRKAERSALTLYPIRNLANELAYVVCIFQGNSTLVEQVRQAAGEETRKAAFGGNMRRILSFGRNAARLMSGERNTKKRGSS